MRSLPELPTHTCMDMDMTHMKDISDGNGHTLRTPPRNGHWRGVDA